MKKSHFVAMILGTIGTVFFALGMCMVLIDTWKMMHQGIVCGVIGLAVLLAAWGIWRRMENKPPIRLNAKTVGTILVAVVGVLLLGIGCACPCCWAKWRPASLSVWWALWPC